MVRRIDGIVRVPPLNDHDQDLLLSTGKLFTQEERREAFTSISAKAKSYSETLVERWDKEIDTYLVYVCTHSNITYSDLRRKLM